MISSLESNCIKFWKNICPCARTPKQRAFQARRGVALFWLIMYFLNVGSDLIVGFDLLSRCHFLTGKVLEKIRFQIQLKIALNVYNVCLLCLITV